MRLRRPVVSLTAALAVTAFAAGPPPARADAPLTTIRIVDAGQDIDALATYAQELGIFKKYGIDAQITLLRKGGGAAAVAAVAGGAADIGEGDIVSVATANERGIQIGLIAPSGIFKASAPTTEVIVANGSPIASGKDLEGKTVALISPEGPSRIATDAWLTKSGAALDKVQFIEVPPIDMAAEVARGVVAAAVINEPSLTAARTTCCRVLANNFTSVGDLWQLNAWYATRDWIAKNPDLAHRFALAIRETAIWANKPENHERSGQLLNAVTPFPPDLLPRMTRATYGEVLDPKTMQPILDAAFAYKALPTPMPAATLISSAALTR
jgi:NitT/TauT family transport system substrate-binding protein